MQTSEILLWVLYAVIVLGLGWFLFRQIQKYRAMGSETLAPPSLAHQKPLRVIKGKTGLQSDILQEGTGEGAKNLDELTVHYVAKLPNGEQVDSSYRRGYPITFKLGTGKVIIGWDQALKGAKVGERRVVTCPSAMAYGSKGKNLVPKNSDIIFEIEVLSIN
ncbi:MAG: FKBP-type peptidyl-prolyl cis-trans isomerase [Bdellovibrionota bacterium]